MQSNALRRFASSARGGKHLVRWKLALVALCSALFLTSCATRLAYNYIDWIVPWYVKDYVDLDSEQKQYLKRQLRVVVAWHREYELPKYAAQLRMFQDQLMSSSYISPQNVEEAFVFTEEAWKRIVKKGMPYLGTLMRTFSDQQTAQLLAALQASEEKRLVKLEKRTVAEQKRRDAKSMTNALERWVGPVESYQSDLITAWAYERPSSMLQWMEYRAYWGEGLVTTLENRRTSSFVPNFQSLVLESDPYASHPYRQYQLPESLRYTAQFLSDFHQTLTERQRQFLNNKLESLILDLEYLHRQ